MLRRLSLMVVPSMAVCSALVCLTLAAHLYDHRDITRSGYIVASS